MVYHAQIFVLPTLNFELLSTVHTSTEEFNGTEPLANRYKTFLN